MRGALKDIAGIANVDVNVGSPDIKVEFDPEQVSVDKIISAIVEGGEEVTKKG